jgi:hypothetical protein
MVDRDKYIMTATIHAKRSLLLSRLAWAGTVHRSINQTPWQEPNF